MSQQVTTFSDDAFPTVPPTKAGVEKMLPDGTILRANRGRVSGLVWALLLAGPVLSQVAGVVESLPGATPTVSSDGHTITAAAPGSFNASSPGGRNDWAPGMRVLVTDGKAPKLAGVFTVLTEGVAPAGGSPGLPWVLVRAFDARTSGMMPAGRSFAVSGGNAAGSIYSHVALAGLSASSEFPEPGIDPLFFTRATFAGVQPYDLYSTTMEGHDAGPLFTVCVNVAAAVADTARDVAVFDGSPGHGAPKDLELISVAMNVQALGASGSAMQARSLPGGGGVALSGPVPTYYAGKMGEGPNGSVGPDLRIMQGGALYLRFADGNAGGRVFLTFRPV